MAADELDRLDRERREADARYNAALTELDRAIVCMDGHALARDDAARIGTALLGFLQQITAFVESKDRQRAAEAGVRLDAVARALEPIAELRTQMAVMRREIETVVSRQSSVVSQQSSVVSQQSSVGSQQSSVGTQQSSLKNQEPSSVSPDDVKYVGFEDQFRGPDEAIEERLRAYVPIFAGCTNVLDVGCGRGELLAALKAAGIPARGIDMNPSMVAAARRRGLDAARADARAYLDEMPDATLGGLVATQVVEHFEPSYLMRVLDAAARALVTGAPIVLETINPACWLAFFSSYLRDFTHVRPVHPDTLQYLLRASGFERVEIRYSAPVPEHIKMRTIDVPAEVIASSDATAAALLRVAHAVNTNAIILNNLMFTHLDYAAIGYRM